MADRRSGYPLETVLAAAKSGWQITETNVDYAPRTGKSKVTGTLTGLTVAGSLYEGGKIAGEHIAQKLEGNGHAVCVTAGQMAMPIRGQSRLAGFYNAVRPYAGITTDHVIAFDLPLSGERYKADGAATAFYHDLDDRLSHVGGVRSVGRRRS